MSRILGGTIGAYKGYTGEFCWDGEYERYSGWVNNTKNIITFSNERVEPLPDEMIWSIDCHLNFCIQQGVVPSLPEDPVQHWHPTAKDLEELHTHAEQGLS